MNLTAQQLLPLLYILVSLLAPVLPAFVIYKLLPKSRTRVEGPFKGLQLKLGGAFGGYFLLVFMSLIFLRSWQAPPDNSYQVWKIQGRLKLEPASSLDRGKVRFSIEPPDVSLTPDGRFTLALVVKRGQTGRVEFPSVIVEQGDDYGPAVLPLTGVDKGSPVAVPLDDGRVITLESDAGEKVINVKEPVVLREKQRDSVPYMAQGDEAQQAVPISSTKTEGNNGTGTLPPGK